jgi:hypothetical protein
LTLAVQEFVSKPESGPLQVDLYNNFISDWEAKMSQQKLVSLGVSAAKQIRGKRGVTLYSLMDIIRPTATFTLSFLSS